MTADSGYTPDYPEVRITQTGDAENAGGILRLDMTREQLAVLARRAKRVDTEEGGLLPISFDLATTRTLAHQCERLAAADGAPIASVTVGGPEAKEHAEVSFGVVLSDEHARQLADDAAAAVANAEEEMETDGNDETDEVGEVEAEETEESDEADEPDEPEVVFRWQLQFTPETAAMFVHQARAALEAEEPILAVEEVDWDDLADE